jgi:hypothetical protein
MSVRLDKPNALGAGVLFAAASVWPAIMSALSSVLASPLERAMQSAWCGVPIHGHTEFMGHCPACWAGSATLAAMGVMLAVACVGRERQASARIRF